MSFKNIFLSSDKMTGSKCDYKMASQVWKIKLRNSELFICGRFTLIHIPTSDPLCFSQELNKERKELILKLVSSLLEGGDNSVLAGDLISVDEEEPIESRLEERAVYNRLAQLPQRDRKAPCKNFFWKTFTSC